jgi:diacylglycerol kinase (ATP)
MDILKFLKKRTDSVKYAVNGIFVIIKTQHNAWLHLLITIIVATTGFLLKIDNSEWIVLVLAIITVWVAEGLNTAIECLGDIVSSDYHPLIGKAKDVAAGAVLIAAIGAAIIGCIVFLPKLSAIW